MCLGRVEVGPHRIKFLSRLSQLASNSIQALGASQLHTLLELLDFPTRRKELLLQRCTFDAFALQRFILFVGQDLGGLPGCECGCLCASRDNSICLQAFDFALRQNQIAAELIGSLPLLFKGSRSKCLGIGNCACLPGGSRCGVLLQRQLRLDCFEIGPRRIKFLSRLSQLASNSIQALGASQLHTLLELLDFPTRRKELLLQRCTFDAFALQRFILFVGQDLGGLPGCECGCLCASRDNSICLQAFDFALRQNQIAAELIGSLPLLFEGSRSKCLGIGNCACLPGGSRCGVLLQRQLRLHCFEIGPRRAELLRQAGSPLMGSEALTVQGGIVTGSLPGGRRSLTNWFDFPGGA